MAALDYLRRAGLSVEAVGDKLRVTPASLITEALGQFVREHKAEILVELIAANESQTGRHIQTAATAKFEWVAARDQFHNHLMTCRACYAPRNRYCLAGTALRHRYIEAPLDLA